MQVHSLLAPVLHQPQHHALADTGGELGRLALQQHVLADEVWRSGDPAEAHAGADGLGHRVDADHAAVHVQRQEGSMHI